MSSMYDCRYENTPAREVYECSDCGCGICVGDYYYEFEDSCICETCMDERKKECEDEEWL